jgi:putative membrane protein
MSESETQEMQETVQSASLVKGLIAGFIGGLVGTAAKSFAEQAFPPRTHGEPEPPETLAEKAAGHPLDEDTKQLAAESIHWGFGSLTGAAYGALVEFYPKAAAKEGATFGMTLCTLTHESVLPVMGVAAKPEEQTFREHSSELASHIVYGVTTELVRSLVRRML